MRATYNVEEGLHVAVRLDHGGGVLRAESADFGQPLCDLLQRRHRRHGQRRAVLVQGLILQRLNVGGLGALLRLVNLFDQLVGALHLCRERRR